MPNSADKPIEVDAALDEDSDVIELTEEVPEENDGGFDLFDDFAMPEFRMPGESPRDGGDPPEHKTEANGVPAGDADAGRKDNVPGAAILGRRSRSRQETPMMELETIKLGTHEIEQAISNQRELQATEKLEAVSRDANLIEPESDAIELEQEVVPEPEEEVPELETLLPEESEVLLEDPIELEEELEEDLEELQVEVEAEPIDLDSAQTQVLGSAPAEPARAPDEPQEQEQPQPEEQDALVLDEELEDDEPADLGEPVDIEVEPLEELLPEPLESGDALLEVNHDEPAQNVAGASATTTREDLDETSAPTMLIGGQAPEPAREEPVASEPPEEQVQEPDTERGFDRQELVRTMQMQAVDRDEIDLAIELERLDNAETVETQRFAPDVLVAPPRVLTKQWREGSPMEPQQPASKPPPVKPISQPPMPKAQQPQAQPGPAAPGGAPPKPAQAFQQPQQPPQQVQQPQQAQPAKSPSPGRPVANRPPQQQQQPVDAEMKGLVDELLDEGAKKPAPKPRRKLSPRDTWFRDVFTDEYLRTLPPHLDQVTERDCKFIERSLSLQPGSRILDLACGFGRHALSLAPRKYEIVGLDLSMALLQRGLAEAQRRNLSIKFVHGDMRSMNFNAIFDGCYLWQTSFGYFDDPTNFKVLQGVHHSLKPGGRFLLDIVNRDFIVTDMPSRCWWEGRECIFLEETDFDHVTSTLHTKRSFIYEDGTPPLEQNSYVRLYSLHELLALFPRAGFRVLEVSGELHHRGRFLGPNSPRIVILAEKVINQQRAPQQPPAGEQK
ncbi:MAG: class I SAM-dependent methyltransferase [Myxococcota bacterium]|nr:class I SAM-dependent methyltransferase [Myxococcota bacterium]